MKATWSMLITLLIVGAFMATSTAGIRDLKQRAVKKQIDGARATEVIYPFNGPQPGDKDSYIPEVQCTVRMVGDSYWAIDEWLFGDEIYKVYQDVDLLPNDCSYPFYVAGVALEMEATYAGTVYVQVDVEELDPSSTDGCPYPGALLGITEEYGFIIPGEGSYLLIMQFDEPVLVDTAYFAGMYFGSGVYDLGPALISDNDPYLCVSWNDWGEGYVDLISNPYFNFPGNLVMYSFGWNAESQIPQSRVQFYSPADSSSHAGSVRLCAAEMTDTVAYEKCVFEYYDVITQWTQIGEDYSADVTLRNSIAPATLNPGYVYDWDISGLPEGWYLLRTLLYESGEIFSADTIEVYVDNTPLKPLLLNPIDGAIACDSATVAAAIPDEDVSFVQFELRESSETISCDLPLLNQYRYGDMDGDTLDMNPYAYGEYGDFYNGPTVVTSLLKSFANQGFDALMSSGSRALSVREMVETIADSSRVRGRNGSQDDNLLGSLVDHLRAQGNQFHVRMSDNIDLNTLLYYTAYRHGVVLLGIDQPYGHWLAVRNLHLPIAIDGSVNCDIYDTKGGLELVSFIAFSPYLGVSYQGLTRQIDRVVAVYPRADTTAREVIGGDFNAADGWSFFWNASTKPDGSYIMAAIGIDAMTHNGEGTAWFQLQCTQPFIKGDVNASGYVDIDDIMYVIDFIFTGGPYPQPETLSGDVNGSGFIDIDDIVYLIDFVFTGGPPPVE